MTSPASPTTQSLTIDQALELAMSHHRSGDLRQAHSIYAKILSHIPEHAVAMHYLGVLMNQVGQQEQAIRLIRRSIELYPNQPAYYNNLGEVYRLVGQYNEAENCFQKSMELSPKDAGVRNNLGLTYLDQGRFEDARSMLESSLKLQPSSAHTLCNLGAALHKLGRLEEAHDVIRRAMLIDPALDAAHTNLSGVLASMGRLDEALQSADTALNLAPEDPRAHLMRAGCLMRAGRLAEAWPEYEWRLRLLPQLVRPYSQPRWAGQELNGQNLLLYPEVEARDAIQYARFIPILRARGGKIILECPAGLAEVLASVGDIEAIVAPGQSPPSFDLHCSLESLPGILQIGLESVSPAIPYLHVDEARVQSRRERLSLIESRLRVGLDCPEIDLSALTSIESVAFVQLRSPRQTVNADLAVEIGAVDLVIATDSPTAHLAGALGQPVWTILSLASDARWMNARDDSPWYPTMRLFRQSQPGDYASVVEDLRSALDQKLSG